MTELPVDLAPSELTILDFWADWCGICRLIDPVVSRVASGHIGVVVKKVNVAEQTEMAERHHVAALPTLVFLSKDAFVV